MNGPARPDLNRGYRSLSFCPGENHAVDRFFASMIIRSALPSIISGAAFEDGSSLFRAGIRDALEKLAAAAGAKIYISDRVHGTIMTSVEDMSPRLVIEVIVNSRGWVRRPK